MKLTLTNVRSSTVGLVALYLCSIIIANLTVAWFGAGVVVVNALVLVALDLTARDKLHRAWEYDGLARKMALLIGAGSLLSAVLDWNALPVAVASCVAFALSETSDALVFSRLESHGWYAAVNGSNAVSALVDSVLFLSCLAGFGLLPWAAVPVLALAQWLAKTLGGAAWSWVLKPS